MLGRMTIAGRPVESAACLDVENPATGEHFAQAQLASSADLDAAVAAATAAAEVWARCAESERRTALRECGALVRSHVAELADLLTREQGKPLREATAEVALAAEWFERTADLSLPPESIADQAAEVTVSRIPHGVVAAITPSNFPVILAVTKIAPALLAGNTVVVKPAELTPLTGLRMAEILNPVLPAGVLNAVCGGAEQGMALVRHPGIGMVSFTGSVETGQAIARAAARDLRPVVLELGGNDACVLLPDADVHSVAAEIFAAAMRNCGQFCAAVKRIYAPRARAAELAAALAAFADDAVVGDGLDPATDLGPLVSHRARTRVAELVAACERAGGEVVVGGKGLERPGHFFAPTVVAGLPAGTALEREEQFGPVIPVIAYDSVAEAVERANATRFGLGGSIWGDPEAARALAASMECGTVWINAHGDLRHDVPFGGIRQSGVGVEYGYWGLLEYTRLKVVNVARRATRTTTPREAKMQEVDERWLRRTLIRANRTIRADRPLLPEHTNVHARTYTAATGPRREPVMMHQVWFRTRGCTYDRAGQCSMCNYGVGPEIDQRRIARSVGNLLATVPEGGCLYLSPSGSLLDDQEVPPDLREQLLRHVAGRRPALFAFESRPELFTAAKLERIRSALPDAVLVGQVGVESWDPAVRNLCHLKPTPQHAYESAARMLAEHGFASIANVTLGAMGLTQREAYDDALASVRGARAAGYTTQMLFPLSAKSGTLLGWAHEHDMWEPPTLWMLVRLLAEAADDAADDERPGDVSISWFAPEIDTVVRSRPDGCRRCRPALLEALDRFRVTPRKSTLREILAWNGCDCPARTDRALCDGVDGRGYLVRLAEIAERWTSGISPLQVLPAG